MFFYLFYKYESNEHIRYLTEENCELSNKLKEIEQELKHSNEKISNLEDCCNQLELQLTDTIKVGQFFLFFVVIFIFENISNF